MDISLGLYEELQAASAIIRSQVRVRVRVKVWDMVKVMCHIPTTGTRIDSFFFSLFNLTLTLTLMSTLTLTLTLTLKTQQSPGRETETPQVQKQYVGDTYRLLYGLISDYSKG
jgi:hypothetical protein